MSQEAAPVRKNVRGSIANDELENIKTELTCKLSSFLDTAIANINSNEYLKEHPSDLLRSFEEIIGNELGKLDTAMQKQTTELPTIEGDGYADGQLVYATWYCPTCHSAYEIDFDKYCPNCGQKINRSELDQL